MSLEEKIWKKLERIEEQQDKQIEVLISLQKDLDYQNLRLKSVESKIKPVHRVVDGLLGIGTVGGIIAVLYKIGILQ